MIAESTDPVIPSDADALVRVRGLTRRFHGKTAVDSLDFDIRRGEILGFLGPNGAGKTTTMRMLTGYLPPTAGSVVIAGWDILANPIEARLATGYMPENVPLYTDMRIKEYLQFRAELKGLKGKPMRQRVGEVMQVCGLTDVRRRLIGNMSKGYRQRIGLADALVHEPELLILDEPTNGFDPNQIRQVRGLIRELAGRHTILLSTHILAEVEQTCDRVIILDEGRIKAIDTPQALAAGLRAAGRIRLEIQCPDGENACERLRGIDGVRTATVESVMADNWHVIELCVESSADVRVAVVDAMRFSAWPLREIHMLPNRLEDVFLELTHRAAR